MTVVRGHAARRLVQRTRARHVPHLNRGTSFGCAGSTMIPSGDEAAAVVMVFVRDQLQCHSMAHRVEDTVMVASELVLNALTHGQGDVVLTLSEDPRGQLSVVVADRGPVTEALKAVLGRHRGVMGAATAAAPDAGRGLEIVGLFTSDWGVQPTARGKDVWALMWPWSGRPGYDTLDTDPDADDVWS